MNNSWPRPRPEPPPRLLARLDTLLCRGVLATLVLTLLVFLIPGWLPALWPTVANASSLSASAATNLEVAALGARAVKCDGHTCYVAAAPVTWNQYAELRAMPDRSSASTPAVVTFFEAVEWLRDHESVLRAKYSTAFAAGGLLADYAMRLPTADLLTAAREGGPVHADSEWLAVASSPQAAPIALNGQLPVAGGAPRLPTEKATFRFVLLPKALWSRYP